MTTSSTTIVVSAAACLMVIVAGAVYMLSLVPAQSVTQDGVTYRVSTARAPLPSPFVIFRTLAPKIMHGRVAMVPLGADERARHITPLSCARVHYASGTGICLVEEQIASAGRHLAYLFHDAFALDEAIELDGVPIRARVSPDGRLASVTTYAEEESATGERLANASILIDAPSRRVVADLRRFAIDPGTFSLTPPIDIAGVAFAPDGDRFFATLATARDRYIASGSVAARRLAVIAGGLANEAVSPDGRHLLVKRLDRERSYWALSVLDLRTLEVRALAQGPRSIDDQVEWLDQDHAVYHDATDEGTGIWVLATDGQSGPRLLIPNAFSPAVQR